MSTDPVIVNLTQNLDKIRKTTQQTRQRNGKRGRSRNDYTTNKTTVVNRNRWTGTKKSRFVNRRTIKEQNRSHQKHQTASRRQNGRHNKQSKECNNKKIEYGEKQPKHRWEIVSATPPRIATTKRIVTPGPQDYTATMWTIQQRETSKRTTNIQQRGW